MGILVDQLSSLLIVLSRSMAVWQAHLGVQVYIAYYTLLRSLWKGYKFLIAMVVYLLP